MRFLGVCVSFTLIARGWLTWQWDSPLRSIFWHEGWLTAPLESLLGISWSNFATRSDPFLTQLFAITGLFLMIAGILFWLLKGKAKLVVLWISTAILFLDSFGRWISADYQMGMAIEHALQIGTPISLILLQKKQKASTAWMSLILVASGLTFIGHGFYAAGVHPVPLNYQTMTMKLLGLEQGRALLVLLIAGWLDIIVALALIFRPLRIPALLYMTIWGGLTALARLLSHAGFGQPRYGLDPWFAETLVRTPHWALPLLAVFYLKRMATPATKID